MHAFVNLAVAITGALHLIVGPALAVPTPLVVDPGTAKDLIITAENTLNGTFGGHSVVETLQQAAGTPQLPLKLVNNYAGAAVNAYVTGLDSNSNVILLQSNGAWFYPPVTSSTTPQPITANVEIPLGGQGTTTTITLPSYISSGRVWFAAGKLQFFTVQDANGVLSLVEPSAVNPTDPSAGINWGFVELTNSAAGGLYADISYVDFVGLVLGMSLLAGDGSTQTALGLQSDAVSQICNALQTQASVEASPGTNYA
jgi:hypothetical protein